MSKESIEMKEKKRLLHVTIDDDDEIPFINNSGSSENKFSHSHRGKEKLVNNNIGIEDIINIKINNSGGGSSSSGNPTSDNNVNNNNNSSPFRMTDKSTTDSSTCDPHHPGKWR